MRNRFLLCSALIVSLAGAGTIPAARAGYKEAVAHYNRGEYEKAIHELQDDLENNRDWEFGHRLLGLCYLNLKDNALAAKSLARAVELGSEAFSTYLGLAQAYFNMEKYRDCVAALDRGKPVADKDGSPETSKAQLYRLRGSANYRLGDYAEAAADLTQSLRLSKPDWTDYTMLGISYLNMKRTDEAISALEKSRSMNPNQTAIGGLLGKAYLGKGTEALSAKQFAQATDLLRKAGEFDPSNGYIFYNLAEAYLFDKKYSEAETSLKRAAALLPQNAGVQLRLGLVYEKMKQWDQALKAYEKAQGMEPSEQLKESIARVRNNRDR